MRVRGALLMLAGCLSLFQVAAAPMHASSPFRPFTSAEQGQLRERLRSAGADSALVAGLRLDTLRCYPSRLRLNLDYNVKQGSYAQYLEAATVQRLQDFLRRESRLFAAAEAKHGVPAEVLGSILMVETRLGENTGQFRAPDLFLTLLLHEGATSEVALDTALARETRFGGTRSRAELEEIIRVKALERARWAGKEIRSLARLIPVRDWDTLPCSYAGAIGLPQFMPTSLAAYGDDGDGNGRVELGVLADAVFSVGRYLKENGWRGRMTADKRFKAIRRYNHSDVYARTVLKLAAAVGLPAAGR
jgi:membrane-bound lytic murein transglycosylase B